MARNNTHSRDASRWYADQHHKNQWTLDYPPLFAMYEAGFAKIASKVDAKIVQESERTSRSLACIRFQRATVVLTELASLGTAVRAATAGDARSALAFAGSGALLLVDHVHFQYNGLLLGLLVYALFMLRRGDHVKAGALFALLCCAKHLFLTLAPVLAAVFVAAHVRPRQDFVKAFLELAGASIAALALGLAPLFIPAWRAGRLGNAMAELAGRLFPFDARGLVHSYWAPNVWALYVFADRVLLKVLRRSAGAGATRLGGDGRRGAARARPEGLRAPDGPRGPAGGLRRGARVQRRGGAAPDLPLRGARGARGLLLRLVPASLALPSLRVDGATHCESVAAMAYGWRPTPSTRHPSRNTPSPRARA